MRTSQWPKVREPEFCIDQCETKEQFMQTLSKVVTHNPITSIAVVVCTDNSVYTYQYDCDWNEMKNAALALSKWAKLMQDEPLLS